MADGDVFRATLECHYQDSGVRVNNVFWFRQTDNTPATPEELSLGTALAATSTSNVGPWQDLRHGQTNQFIWDRWRVQRMTPGIPGGAFLVAAPKSGEANSLIVPSICALDVKLQSERNDRRGRGRIYLAGFATSSIITADGAMVLGSTRWSNVLVIRATAMMADLQAKFAAGGTGLYPWEWGVWSKLNAGHPAPYNPVAFAPLASFVVDPIVRCQRRREEDVGF